MLTGWPNLPDGNSTMARARQSVTFTDLLEVASRLPWKVSLGVAGISLLALHLLAAAFAPTPTAITVADMGGVVIHQAIHMGAFFLQFVVPPAFLIGAAVSYFKRSQSIRLFEATRTGTGPVVASLTWRQFESLVAEGFRQRGFQVTEKGGAAADGGVDLILARGNERFLVQCKQWRAQQVPVTIVRELYGVMAAQQAAGGYVVTSGRFTQDAIAFAEGRNIELIDGVTLPTLLRHHQNAQPAPTTTMTNTNIASTPACPRCNEPMVTRVAKRGASSGSEFWGCRRYPKCNATLAKT
jgi:restriction system protein